MKQRLHSFIFILTLLLAAGGPALHPANAQGVRFRQPLEFPSQPEPLGIAMENYDYPWPVRFLPMNLEGKEVRMAFMDVHPERPNGRSVLLLHGKNFFGAYWEGVIRELSRQGYRVIVPDQIGFGKSSKPDIHYSFHEMSSQTLQLLDALGVESTAVVGHSMGGMLATRFVLMFPERSSHLVLENPIGLEDYRITPWVPLETIYQGVLAQTEEGIRNYHRTYYVEWKPEYDEYVQVHYRWTLSGEYPRLARVSALTTRMIYEQPVIHELEQIRVPALLVIGQEDRTAIGRNRAAPEVASAMGNYPELGRAAAARIPDAELLELENVGHIPHLEAFGPFMDALLRFLGR